VALGDDRLSRSRDEQDVRLEHVARREDTSMGAMKTSPSRRVRTCVCSAAPRLTEML
jgi:hypothetical protein